MNPSDRHEVGECEANDAGPARKRTSLRPIINKPAPAGSAPPSRGGRVAMIVFAVTLFLVVGGWA